MAKLQIGDNAPDFTLVTLGANGPELITLSKHIGEENILILFVPMAFTGTCTSELCDISSNLSAYKSLGAKVFGISGDNPFAQKAWAEKESIKIPLLSDYEHDVARSYGVAYDSFIPEKNLTMGGVAKRSAFIINKEGKIQYVEILDSPGDLPNFDAIQSCLANMS